MRQFSTFVIALALGTISNSSEATDVSVMPVKRQVEVAFVLDTTGSMGGLIQAAKEKIWAIANTLALAKPAPEIKMAVVGFRDRGDEYITKVTDLSEDLDQVYTDLMAFTADGGGDGPESVNQALHEAATHLSWSSDGDVYKVIFLVGDSPPHMDYENDVPYAETCKLAIESGISVNSIQCGDNSSTTPVWEEIARRAEGRYFRVEQDGGAILASTPFDTELAELSGDLDETRLYYGTTEQKAANLERDARVAGVMEAAPPAAKAGRAFFNASEAGAKNLLGDRELVNRVSNGIVHLRDLDDDMLPEPMQEMTLEEREKFVAEKSEQREEIQAKINTLAKQRQEYIEEQARKSRLGGKDTLDSAIFESIKEQAGKKGIQFEGGPQL